MSEIQTVYIMSPGHSGSTLLNLLLGGHPAAVAVGEVTHLPKNIALNTACSCGAPVRQCDFWRPVVQALSASLGRDLLDQPYALNLGYIGATHVVDHQVMTRNYRRLWKLRHAMAYASARVGLPDGLWRRTRVMDGARNTHRLFDVIRGVANVRVVVDSSKDYVKGLAMYRARPESTRLLLLIRDGRAVFYSGIRRGLAPNYAIDRWLNYYSRALPMLHRTETDSVLRVHYEDVATDTAATLARLCEFVGLRFEPVMLDIGAHTAHIANGNAMRQRGRRSVAYDHTWRDGLTTSQLTFFERRAGLLNEKLGYTAT